MSDIAHWPATLHAARPAFKDFDLKAALSYAAFAASLLVLAAIVFGVL